MKMITRINNKLFREHLKLLSTKKIIAIAKRYIKKSRFMPIPIMYHKVTNKYCDSLSVSKKVMEQNLIFLKKCGFTFLFEDEIFNSIDYSVILTFDDGYQNNYENLFPLLKKHNAKATINIIAKKLVDETESDYLNSKEIKEMLDSKLVSFQSHSYSHRKLIDCNEAELEFELKHSKEVLEKTINNQCSVLVTPYLQNSQLITSVAKKHYDIIYSDSIRDTEFKYCISRIGSSDNMSEHKFAEKICLKARENAKINR